MSGHRFVLLLGSGTDHEDKLQQARLRLLEMGSIVSQSALVHAPSVLPGDGHRYVNQAVLIETASARDEVAVALKSLETALGRRADDEVCQIDIDLVCECDEAGAVIWHNPVKLEHPLFRDLVQQALSGGVRL